MIFITLPRVVHGSVSLGRLDSIFHVKTYQLTYRFRFLDILTRCRPLPELSWMVSSLGLGGLGGCRSDLDTSLPPIVAITERKKKKALLLAHSSQSPIPLETFQSIWPLYPPAFHHLNHATSHLGNPQSNSILLNKNPNVPTLV